MTGRRRIAALTTSRAEYGLLRGLLGRLHRHPGFALQVLVSGSHLAPTHGHTIDAVEADGVPIARRIPTLLAGDTPLEAAESAGLGLILLGQALADLRPDALVLLGDRYELLPAAAAAAVFGVPITHIHGGEVTLGALDDGIRHALTKLSSYHFVATRDSARRVMQMGEPRNRVFRVGALSVDAIRETPRITRSRLQEHFGMRLDRPVAVVALHPETRSELSPRDHARALVRALERFGLTAVITYPNADPGREDILQELRGYKRRHPDRTRLVASLGQTLYYSVLAQADLMVGNSSSGLVEAPSFRVPVVNIGDRERGRERARNVIDCRPEPDCIARAIQRALSSRFRQTLRGLRNPFGDGHAAERIVRALSRVPLGHEALVKGFADLPRPRRIGRQGRRS
ncbi:MAG: UDP-N-acetylglucosamine 2-epimerase (hydrolyzing) [Armatimonadota bacterium]|nr:MAG: UDP-N-acetylglucosamine 2-epimerase (hydrolyzing) [Armatimonadota bacterium]